ncbi:hypothetical protein [Phenylobacterium sp. J367]|uniref:hypothetical protein n=1 Tax=Phenylobacterium sp. J367 TaxID=2898435 RepID=UPI002150B58A|nr:hypothetical protein [Phenylobacterium sp. J367]MCR5876951.1 hypothetical protein [Phenylobacterium sp. J367]MCR5877019.1 hypothetical protein [Phenylobacterium sp. J367]
MKTVSVPSRPRNGWTAERVIALNAMIEAGATVEEMAAALGRTTNSIRAKLGAEHIPARATAAAAALSSRPDPVRSSDDVHLMQVARANNGKGFPFYDLRAAYRVAA